MAKIETNLGAVMIVHSGAHDSTSAYSRLRVVEYNGSSYISIQDVPENILISNTNYWRVICKGALQTWIEQGHEGTYADFIAWLQEPANSAAEAALDTIENLVLTVTEAETNRSTAEQTRQTNETARVAAETARNVASNVYNVTLSVPLAAGQYYTSTTARAAVPVGVRKRGLELVYETSVGVWFSERFIGSDVAAWTTATNWERLPMNADFQAWTPSVIYANRVALDGGTIRDKSLLKAMCDDALNLLPNTDLWYNLECGIKTRVSGLNTYVTKVYDLSTNNRDATQATEAFQPYLVGNINPANRYAIWGRERYFPFSQPIIKSGSDQWSLSITANRLSTNSPFTSSPTDSAIYFFPTYIYFVNKFGAVSILNHPIQNAISRYYLVAKNGMLQFYLNGKFIGYSEINTAIDITNLFIRDTNIYDFRIFNKALNKSEIEFLDAKMSAFYPQFEGVTIGNQVWEASNAMDMITPDSTEIPEVTDNTAWAALTTPAWCYYNNSEANGAVYGRIYNGYAVQKLTGSPIWRAPMSADFSQLSAFLGGDAVAGGKLKAEGLTYWASPNTGATNESGFTAICSGVRFQNGDFVGGIGSSPNVLALATIDDSVYPIINSSSEFPAQGILGYLPNRGYSLRRIRRVPPGELVREITSGVFSFPISGGSFKDIPIPNAYRVTALKVTSSTNLTNFTAEVRTSAGVLVQSILSNETINSADTPVIINISARQMLQLQDYVVRITAAGNGGNGMEVITIIEKAVV